MNDLRAIIRGAAGNVCIGRHDASDRCHITYRGINILSKPYTPVADGHSCAGETP